MNLFFAAGELFEADNKLLSNPSLSICLLSVNNLIFYQNLLGRVLMPH